jgi:hypothetical protein
MPRVAFCGVLLRRRVLVARNGAGAGAVTGCPLRPEKSMKAVSAQLYSNGLRVTLEVASCFEHKKDSREGIQQQGQQPHADSLAVEIRLRRRKPG